jgi:hypothetical protein
MAIIGLATVAVCAIGLQVWKPWEKSGGIADAGVASASPAKQSSERDVGSSKAQVDSAKPIEKPAASAVKKSQAPQVVGAGWSTPDPKTTPAVENKVGESGDKTSPALSSTPQAKPTPVAAVTADSLKPSEPPASVPKTSMPLPASPPGGGATPVSATAASPAVAATPAAPNKVALPEELAILDDQFQKLQLERVASPFETDVAKLNTSYTGGIEREIAAQKTAGNLDAVLALEEEKKLIREKHSVPGLEEESSSDKKVPDPLKILRAKYREAHATLEARRAANLRALTDPLAVRLQSIESELTRKDRIADAKIVREYREALGSALETVASDTRSAQEIAHATPPRRWVPRH